MGELRNPAIQQKFDAWLSSRLQFDSQAAVPLRSLPASHAVEDEVDRCPSSQRFDAWRRAKPFVLLDTSPSALIPARAPHAPERSLLAWRNLWLRLRAIPLACVRAARALVRLARP